MGARRLSRALLLLVLVQSMAIAVRATDREKKNDTVSSFSSSSCGVYYAPSTIPGAGFGLFAGINYDEGDEVTPGDLVVPYVDMEWHNDAVDADEMQFLWNEYSWDSAGFPGMDQEANSISAASFGIGAAPNCWLPLVNVEDGYTDFDQAGVHRSKDPGAGAFTPYYNRRGFATTDIPAGMEIFVDYGFDYFDSRDYGPVPRDSDFDLGDELFQRFWNLTQSLSGGMTDTCAARDDCGPENDVQIGKVQQSLFDLFASFKETYPSRVLTTLPSDHAVLDMVADLGVRYSEYHRSVRSVEWLETHGTCMDNLRVGLSSLASEQAGRGGYAHRSIGAGEIVVPLPLIHADRKIFDMYAPKAGTHPDDSDYVADRSHPVHSQLLLNYCFGHRNTSVVLCPYGINAGLINHSKELANSKIVWSEKSMRRAQWLEQSPDEWMKELTAGLAFDLVATRDIVKGEEVLLDYGEEWEEAWNRHVAEWEPPTKADTYMQGFELEGVERLRTVSEGFYPAESVQVYCRDEFRVWSGLEEGEVDLQLCRIADRYKDENGDYRYRAEIVEQVEYMDALHCFEELLEVLFDVPRDCFHLEDTLYSRDHTQTWSFRHDMRIPDELLPPSWVNE